MTPKQKAKILVDKFVGIKVNDYKEPKMKLKLSKAKRKTLLCIDEIIEELKICQKFYCENNYYGLRIDFLKLVKEEVNQL